MPPLKKRNSYSQVIIFFKEDTKDGAIDNVRKINPVQQRIESG
jgi:hypothetical protein